MTTLRTELARRIGPFVALLDARYLPLLFAVIPQAWAVYAWLLASEVPPTVATFGAIGYEAVYIAAVAWAEYGAGNVWAQRRTAFGALVFSIAVAVYHYWPLQGWGALLHAGFPLVAYLLTLQMHVPAPHAPEPTQAAHVSIAPPLALTTDAPTMPALSASAPTHQCRKCGAPVASAQASSASARWGCAGCKVSSARAAHSIAEEA